MRFRWEDGCLRVFSDRNGEIAYLSFGLHGPRALIEFPTTWHEHARGWVTLGLGVVNIGVSFPWKELAPDFMQCAGPTYGFAFFDDVLITHYGQDQGLRSDPTKVFNMPWAWRNGKLDEAGTKQTYAYVYKLKNGEIQHRWATIHEELRSWTRPWLPSKRVERSINVTFSDEVGERSGSWKGGCIGCGYQMLPGETPYETLRRMERERKF
jgi:hypothetical protein